MLERYVSMPELIEYTGLSKKHARDLAALSGCKVRQGYDLQKVDDFLKSKSRKVVNGKIGEIMPDGRIIFWIKKKSVRPF